MTTQPADTAQTRSVELFKDLCRTSRQHSDRYVRVVCSFRDIAQSYDIPVKSRVASVEDIDKDARSKASILHKAARQFKDDFGIHRCTKVKVILRGLYLEEN